MNFADRLQASIKSRNSFLVAGFDPQLEALPRFVREEAARQRTSAESVRWALSTFHHQALIALHQQVAAIKPNIAFFEQYGSPGLEALHEICAEAKNLNLPVIIDGKRSDIGNTAAAYSRTFLGKSKFFSESSAVLDVDALTVSPYLGFDTLEPFMKDCLEYGKGIYVLVKTSNPGSKALQDLVISDGRKVSEVVADWLGEQAVKLQGTSGYSSLGAVVGATYPEEAKKLRARMPNNLFLIPGMGAQGGDAAQAIAGFDYSRATPGGALINMSRGLMSTFATEPTSFSELAIALEENASRANAEIWETIKTRVVTR